MSSLMEPDGKTHRQRLETMQQERIIDPNAKMKRFHIRQITNPMLMRWWVPMLITGIAGLYCAFDLNKEQNKRKKRMLKEKIYEGAKDPQGISIADRNAMMHEHLDRVIKGEDAWYIMLYIYHTNTKYI